MRVVGQQAQAAHPQVEQDLRAYPVIAQVGGKTQALVGLDRVSPLILELSLLPL